MKATIIAIRPESDNVTSFDLATDQRLDYIAGQFIALTIHHGSVDSKGDQRWFTISSSPSEPHVTITSKWHAPASSFKQALWGLRVGDEVIIGDAIGDFVLPLDVTMPLLWLAAGVGVTPLRSMAQSIIDTREQRPIVTIQIVAAGETALFSSILQTVSDAGYFIYQNGKQQMTASFALQRWPYRDTGLIYISGPESFVDSLEADLSNLGIRAQQIITDAFLGYT